MSKPRTEKRDVHGWIVLDKPTGVTSTQAVGAVRWALRAKKAGHAGTLDPLATGVLPIALGEATKTVPYALDGEKSYLFTVRWGAETDTDDSEGKVTATSATRPTIDAIRDALADYVGEIEQTPPKYSAVKIDGERAYDLARDGEEVEIAPRQVVVHRLDLVETPDADTAVFACDCGKGTYVRALARDIGRDLCCLGHVIQLRRTRVGAFHESEATALDDVKALREDPMALDAARAFLRPAESALSDLVEVPVGRSDADKVRRGQAIILRGRDAPIVQGEVYVTSGGDLVAIGRVEQGMFQPSRVFHLGG
jgi:tRNA pseudouridine55 synthase